MNKKRLKYIIPLIVSLLSLLLILEKGFLSGLSPQLTPNKNLHLLEMVINLIRNDYVEKPNPSLTMKGAFQGAINSLDPLSCYLDEETTLLYQKQEETVCKETGLVLYKKFGSFPQVIGIKENSPAENKDIQIGDYITTLNTNSTLNMSMIEVNLLLNQKEVSSLNLKLLRNGKTHRVKLERELISKEFFSYTPAEKTSGILKIHKIFSPCVKKLNSKVIPRLEEEKKTLILDLRNCYQGDFSEAQKLMDIFLSSNHLGYFTKNGEKKKELSSSEKAELKEIPVVAWINQATLGPAEAVAGVLKEKGRARLIGFPTPGLAANLNFFPFEDGSGALLVSSLFHLPSGKKIWQKGVEPDIKMEGKNESTQAFLNKTYLHLTKS